MSNFNEIKSSKVIAESHYCKNKVSNWMLCGIFSFGGSFILFYTYYYLFYGYEKRGRYNWFTKEMMYETEYWEKDGIRQLLTALLILGGLLLLIAGILSFIKQSVLKKSYVCVTELGVYGMGGKMGYLSVQPFNISKEQITNITTKKDSFIIESGSNIYICAVNEPNVIDFLYININISLKNSSRQNFNSTNMNDTTSIICPNCNSKIENDSKYCVVCGHKIPVESTNKFPNQSYGSNEWKCPKCGKINQNYVGTCGCGQVKP